MSVTIRPLRLGAVAAAIVVAVVMTWLSVGGTHHGVAAAADSNSSNAGITVSGVGTVQGVPDTLTATFGVHVTRSSVQSALDGESASVGRVLAALKKAGVSGRDVQTTSLQLSPHYNNHGTVTGYDAYETVAAKVSPLTHAGRIISAAAASSGNDVSVNGLSFDVADDRSLLKSARAQAFSDAKDRAQQYAELSGRSLGAVQKISEVVNQTPTPLPYEKGALSAAASAPAAVPIRPGEQPVTVSVTVVWALA